MAQHQLRRLRVHGHGDVEHADIDTPRAELERGATGEERGARHAARPTEDRHGAGEALVEVARPALQHRLEELARRDPGARLVGLEAEIRHADLAAMIWSVERKQSRLQRDESDRMGRAHCATHHPAGVGMQAARDVEGEYRTVLAVRVLHHACIFAVDVAREADAEEAVDDKAPFPVGNLLHAARHAHAVELLLQAGGGNARIAAVVARPGEHEDVLFLVGGELRR